MTSYAKPTEQQVDAVVPLLSAPAPSRYFFDRLDNPEWIEPLAKRDFFRDAPPVVSVEGGGVKCPPWPESRYLARMAKPAPTAVADILQGIDTDNSSIIQAMLDAVANMPANVAATLIPKLCTAHKLGLLVRGFPDAAEQCARLAREGEPEAAMDLARCLFSITDAQDLDRPSRRDMHWYVEGLQSAIPALVAARTKDFLTFLLNNLRVVADHRSRPVVDDEYDTSPWWRPAIEEHEGNPDYDLASQCVGSVRDALEKAIKGKHTTLAEVLELLAVFPRLVFKRLRIHLINEFSNQAPRLACSVLMTRELLDDFRYKHEYAMLVRRRFLMLAQDEQDRWLSWVDAGPDMSDFDESIRRDLRREPTEEDRESRIEHWQFQKLNWIRDHLTGERLDFYNRVGAEHGEPELADLNIKRGVGRWGDRSPFSADDFAERDFHDVVDTVSDWRPDRYGPSEPSVEGLAATFRQYLAQAPEKYVEQASIMKERPAIYVRTYIGAMTDDLAKVKSCNLWPLLDLCRWVLSRPLAESTCIDVAPGPLEDRDWQWTRDSISRFVEAACRQECSLDYRGDLWALIEPLTGDSSQSYVVGTADDDPRTTDYAVVSLNSPCGTAMHAAFAYARWVAKAVAEDTGGHEVVKGGFDQMPEVRTLLETKLAPTDPGGFAARATYGWHWPLLNWLDPDWLARHAGRICDLAVIESTPEKAYGWAAWNTFLMSAQPRIEYYQVLREQFSYAVDQASTISGDDNDRDQPCHMLAQHLIVLYGRGQLTLDDDDSIIRRLLTRTPPAVRTQAVQFIGESLWRDQITDIPDAARNRFVALWDWCWEATGEADANTNPNSSAFGYWFASGAFEPQWALERLEQFVHVVPKPQPDSELVEKLAEIAHVDMLRSVRILSHLVDGDDENWHIYGWRDSAKRVLRSAIEAGGAACDEAKAVVDRLGRRGFVEFGEVLDM